MPSRTSYHNTLWLCGRTALLAHGNGRCTACRPAEERPFRTMDAPRRLPCAFPVSLSFPNSGLSGCRLRRPPLFAHVWDAILWVCPSPDSALLALHPCPLSPDCLWYMYSAVCCRRRGELWSLESTAAATSSPATVAVAQNSTLHIGKHRTPQLAARDRGGRGRGRESKKRERRGGSRLWDGPHRMPPPLTKSRIEGEGEQRGGEGHPGIVQGRGGRSVPASYRRRRSLRCV